LSEQDRELLIKAGLSAAKVAKILNRSRQAVSKGIAAETDYLTPKTLVELREGVGQLYPEVVAPLQEGISDKLRDLAERLGSSVPDQVGMAATISQAHRLWLILPGFSDSFARQRDHYYALIHMIDQRRPGQDGSSQLEVVVFCDRNRAEIEDHFAASWFETRHLAVVQCELVQQIFSPIEVVNPHLDGGTACYTLAKNGFEPLEPDVARSRVSHFAELVSEKIREKTHTTGQPGAGRSVNVLTAPPAVLLDVGLDRIKI
jgi:hypothetical protein